MRVLVASRIQEVWEVRMAGDVESEGKQKWQYFAYGKWMYLTLKHDIALHYLWVVNVAYQLF